MDIKHPFKTYEDIKVSMFYITFYKYLNLNVKDDAYFSIYYNILLNEYNDK